MKTKEEILDEKQNRPDEMLIDWIMVSRKNALEAMGDYAIEIAIDFETWQRIEERKGNTNVYGKTPKQLFDLYQQEKSSLK